MNPGPRATTQVADTTTTSPTTRTFETVSILSKLLRAGEGRKLKKYTALADYVDSLSADTEKLTCLLYTSPSPRD